MIVCCCNAFNDRAVETAISGGARSVAQVYKAIGVTPRCGTCKDEIQSRISERLGGMGADRPMAAVA